VSDVFITCTHNVVILMRAAVSACECECLAGYCSH